jgi:hypothetical protein
LRKIRRMILPLRVFGRPAHTQASSTAHSTNQLGQST